VSTGYSSRSSQKVSHVTVIDLTKSLSATIDIYPGDPEVDISVVQNLSETGWEVRSLSMGSHTGTHVDAFSHAVPGGDALDHIPLHRFAGKARRIRPHGPLPHEVGLIFDHHISVQQEAEILAARPPFIGGPGLDGDLERSLLAAGILTFDGLTNLDALPMDTPFTFCGFPLKIADGDGSPIRVVALVF